MKVNVYHCNLRMYYDFLVYMNIMAKMKFKVVIFQLYSW